MILMQNFFFKRCVGPQTLPLEVKILIPPLRCSFVTAGHRSESQIKRSLKFGFNKLSLETATDIDRSHGRNTNCCLISNGCPFLSSPKTKPNKLVLLVLPALRCVMLELKKTDKREIN